MLTGGAKTSNRHSKRFAVRFWLFIRVVVSGESAMADAKIRIWMSEKGPTISPFIYGHFIEHLGRCIYDGLWVGEKSKIPNRAGLRSDVFEAFGRVNPPILRWPGGCFADDYHWQDGIGPRTKRPRTLNLHYKTEETNEFGTHEFIELCRNLRTEPYICLNVGSGNPSEAKAWVEYCNYARDTRWADLRRKNGAKEPLGVRFWGIGNEPWGCGALMNPENYSTEYKRFACYIKDFDNSLQLVAAGHAATGWNLKLMEGLRDDLNLVDYLSIHAYLSAGGALDFTERDYYNLLGGRAADLEYHIKRAEEVVGYYERGYKDVGIAVDEWGTWNQSWNIKEHGFEAPMTLRDALFAAQALHIFQRHSRKVRMANIAQAVNIGHCLFKTQGESLILTPTYYVFRMMRAHQGEKALPVDVDCGTFDTISGLPKREQKPYPLLSVSASLSRKSDLTISVLNADLKADILSEIHLDGGFGRFSASVEVLSADDVRAVNSVEEPKKVRPRRKRIPRAGKRFSHLFPKHSLTVMRLHPF